jgi:hypothetical protein
MASAIEKDDHLGFQRIAPACTMDLDHLDLLRDRMLPRLRAGLARAA